MRLGGQHPSQICRHLERSSTWFYKWWNRFVEAGPDQLEDRSRVPHQVAKKTAPQIEQAILKLRRIKEARDRPHTKYALVGAPAIQRELQALDFPGVPALRTSEEILRRHGLTHPKVKAKRLRAPREYPSPQAEKPNEVHQLDLVGPWDLPHQSAKRYL